MSFNPKALKQAVADAPEAGFASYNFGRLSVEPNIATWSGKKGQKRVKTTRPMRDGESLGKGESLEIKFTVDIRELNPSLEFTYERDVVVRKSSAREDTDWSEIVEPSLIAVFGKDWADAVGQGPYVCVEDYPNVAGRKSDKGRVFGVPKFIARYASLAECLAAKELQFGASASADSAQASEALPGGVPVGVATAYQALKSALGEGNEGMVAEMVAIEPTYSGFTIEQLEAALGELPS